jgi:hypothetical protein
VKIDDRKTAEDLYAYHVPVFQKIPRPSFPGIETLREFFVANEADASRFLPARFHAHLIFGLAGRAGIILHAGALLVAAHFAA